jgi:ketosteroid isomerase-like protein
VSPAEQAVLEANERFYRAMSEQDLEAMEAAWLPADWVQCVHPGWMVLHGWPAVRKSWIGIFGSPSRLSASVEDVRVRLAGDVAWVSCTERVSAVLPDQLDTSLAQATNIFVAVGGAWRLVVHHASPLALAEPGAWTSDSESVH